jgi:hypothetical protein
VAASSRPEEAMTDYSKMSDFEINKAVAEELFKERLSLIVKRDVPSRPAVTVFADIGNGEIVSITCADYCNNPADAWPIITDMRPNIIPVRSKSAKWSIAVNTGQTLNEMDMDENKFFYTDSNLLRGCMIVFLMMKETEQCSS